MKVGKKLFWNSEKLLVVYEQILGEIQIEARLGAYQFILAKNNNNKLDELKIINFSLKISQDFNLEI